MKAYGVRGANRPLAGGAARRAFFALLVLGSSSCLYGDSRCSPGQVLYNDAVCACPEGSTFTPQGCIRCGENEVAGPTGCTCAPGFSRTSAEVACTEAPPALGLECDTASAPCADPHYSHCQVVSGTRGYCTTSGCASSAECEGGYACDTRATPSYCRRRPIGLHTPCEGPETCADTEAKWCDTFMMTGCIVQGCSVASQDCFEGYQCCDLSAFGVPTPLCLPAGAC
jgi:hypothetical protein